MTPNGSESDANERGDERNLVTCHGTLLPPRPRANNKTWKMVSRHRRVAEQLRIQVHPLGEVHEDCNRVSAAQLARTPRDVSDLHLDDRAQCGRVQRDSLQRIRGGGREAGREGCGVKGEIRARRGSRRRGGVVVSLFCSKIAKATTGTCLLWLRNVHAQEKVKPIRTSSYG